MLGGQKCRATMHGKAVCPCQVKRCSRILCRMREVFAIFGARFINLEGRRQLWLLRGSPPATGSTFLKSRFGTAILALEAHPARFHMMHHVSELTNLCKAVCLSIAAAGSGALAPDTTEATTARPHAYVYCWTRVVGARRPNNRTRFSCNHSLAERGHRR